MPLRQSLDDTIIRLKEEIRGIEMEIMGQRILEMAQNEKRTFPKESPLWW